MRFETGIGAKLEFKFVKGHRNPYAGVNIEDKDCFTLPPSTGDQPELDLSLVLLSLAFDRGLFGSRTPEELWEGPEKYIEQDEDVANQAGFVQSDQAGVLDTELAMKEASLNPKLREMCQSVGLVARDSMYAFRRLAITEVRRGSGTEFAKEFAGHKMGGRSMYAYDNLGMQDVDMQNMRLGTEEVYSRTELRKIFGQVPDQLWTGDTETAEQANYRRAEELMIEDTQYKDVEKKLRDILRDCAVLLDMPDLGYNESIVNSYSKKLQAMDDDIDADSGDQRRAQQGLRTYWVLHEKYRKEVKEQQSTEVKAASKVASKRSKTTEGVRWAYTSSAMHGFLRRRRGLYQAAAGPRA
ncbi:hypothetical protein CLAFUW4_11424 [Fulvia fulva]|uniref:Uncharacterized protein n=1 Tax=Passalora fulva TaxID=5499 RepID=A0A9Q8US25_PASFU|nr:uncharacterized protein CLAFUR5_10465 [Fulvia fulva]KAK4619465.1 hypothetical protein CLAFUR4_11430 [Fulvia fulva]UJO20322.1 hypothetical protein CLAFUR5_10465 [Fulvia fulva]WPV17088.1 hypothetical protein CLAFUW4_11424 [Fulvia fulva]WPV32669.1 hypothetical protein CLAFUW7_11420 [Fulvia fulva]